MAMSNALSSKLRKATVTGPSVKILVEQGLDTETALRTVTDDQLQEIGITNLGDRTKIKGTFPCADPTAPAAAPTESRSGIADALKGISGELAQALVSADREVCPHCRAVMAKNFNGKNCTKCGMPIKSSIKCISCGKENQEVKAGDFCSQCAEPLVTGESRQQVAYLMRIKGFAASPATSELKRISGDETEYARFKAQVEAWVEEGGFADVANATFRNQQQRVI